MEGTDQPRSHDAQNQMEVLLRREKEVRDDLNRAQEIAHIGSWRMNVVKNQLLWSDEAYRIFEIPVGTPISYEVFMSAIHPDDRTDVDASWQEALRGQKYDIEHRIIVPSGLKWVRETAVLEIDNTGKLQGGFGTVQDITSAKKMQEMLNKKNDSLTRINGLLKDFVSIAAHDLRSPVSNLLTMSEYITMLESIENKEKAFTRLVPQVKKLQMTIDGLLEMINVETKSDTVLKQLEFNNVLHSVLADCRHEYPNKKYEIQTDFNVPGILYVEAYLISVVKNLISNAIKY